MSASTYYLHICIYTYTDLCLLLFNKLPCSFTNLLVCYIYVVNCSFQLLKGNALSEEVLNARHSEYKAKARALFASSHRVMNPEYLHPAINNLETAIKTIYEVIVQDNARKLRVSARHDFQSCSGKASIWYRLSNDIVKKTYLILQIVQISLQS